MALTQKLDKSNWSLIFEGPKCREEEKRKRRREEEEKKKRREEERKSKKGMEL